LEKSHEASSFKTSGKNSEPTGKISASQRNFCSLQLDTLLQLTGRSISERGVEVFFLKKWLGTAGLWKSLTG